MAIRKLLTGAAVLAVALGAAAAATAGPPPPPPPPPKPPPPPPHGHVVVTHYKHLAGNYQDDQCAGAPYGFEIQVTGFDDVTITDTYDAQGNLLREQTHDKQTATATANGKTLDQSEDANITTDYVQNTQTWDGVEAKYQIPKGKILIQDTGHIVFDLNTGAILQESGQHPLADGSTAVCDYFAS